MHSMWIGKPMQPCVHCGKKIGLRKWDSWNGFLVGCPHCGGLHGKRWNIRRFLFASFVFNAVSFLFTMRLARAAIALSGFLVFAILVNFLIGSNQIPDILEIILVSVILLGPMLINAIVLIKHERDLDNSASPAQVISSQS